MSSLPCASPLEMANFMRRQVNSGTLVQTLQQRLNMMNATETLSHAEAEFLLLVTSNKYWSSRYFILKPKENARNLLKQKNKLLLR